MTKFVLHYFILVLLIGTACGSFDPCQNKELFIKKHTAFIEKINKENEDLSDDEWKKTDEVFEELTNECYKNIEDQMSRDEKKDFWIRNSKYMALRLDDQAGNSADILSSLMESIGDDGSKIAEGLAEAFGEDFETTIEEFGDDINEIFDEDFKQKIEDIFDEDFQNKLKKTFENLGESLKDLGDDIKEAVEEIDPN